MTLPEMTIGIPVYDDMGGIVFTVQSLRMHHKKDIARCEILVVDNNPDGPEGQHLQTFCVNAGIRYVPLKEPKGTAAAKDATFRLASGMSVLTIDSHVLLANGAIESLLNYWKENPRSRDLIQGPLMMDDLNQVSTHFDDRWSSCMWGTWATDPRGIDPTAPPFEIMAQGTGLFSMLRTAWPGFNTLFRGFGGEEQYIHEKVRRRGGRVLCHPAVRWWHRFYRPGGVAYPLSSKDKAWNTIVGLTELGIPLDRARAEFIGTKSIIESDWDMIEADAIAAVTAQKNTNADCPPCRASSTTPYEMSNIPDTPISVVSYAPRPSSPTTEVPHIPDLADALSIQEHPGDCIIIEGQHTAAACYNALVTRAATATRWIAIRGIRRFGEQGPDKGPGILPAVRRYLKEHPEWTARQTDKTTGQGVILLTKDPADKKQLPSLWRQGWNALQASARAGQFVMTGFGPLVGTEVFERRLSICTLCPSRTDTRCGECGCPIEKKASYPQEFCPIGNWHEVDKR